MVVSFNADSSGAMKVEPDIAIRLRHIIKRFNTLVANDSELK